MRRFGWKAAASWQSVFEETLKPPLHPLAHGLNQGGAELQTFRLCLLKVLHRDCESRQGEAQVGLVLTLHEKLQGMKVTHQ